MPRSYHEIINELNAELQEKHEKIVALEKKVKKLQEGSKKKKPASKPGMPVED